MEQVIRIGMDTSKSVFQLHGVDALERPVLIRKLQRRAVVPFFARLAPVKVGLEACGGSHHWARTLSALGHDPVLMAAQHVKAYLRRGKHDAADAEANCEAMSRPRTRFVAVKSVEQQAGQMLFGVREQMVRRRTQLSNAIRGHAAEFGLVAAKGLAHVKPLLARVAADDGVPALAQELFNMLGEEYRATCTRLAALEKKLVAHYRQDETARRLAAMPGVGPIGATLLGIKVGDATAFRSGRDFAAWLGLTPKNHSTAGKTRLGVITRAGDEMLRQVLVVGATAHIQQVRRGRIAASPWLAALLARKPPKLAAVALANKNARFAWKMMVTGEPYRCDQAGSLAPASPPSRPSGAACGGGLRPALTAAPSDAAMP
ncbi:transposase [Mesorhizobium delmotii]|uniref:Transposase n=1 Tax=Mesorhizobium delmotii TaxID=1631247 RepID=A0A2P9AJG7_9HYPH|nr:transposase [Mesorhizobium delmotii]